MVSGNSAGLRLLQSKREPTGSTSVAMPSTSSAPSTDMELDMSVDSIDAEPEEDEENEPLIDSDDEGDENSPDSDD